MPQASDELRAVWHTEEAGYDDGAWMYLKGLGWEEDRGVLIPHSDGPWLDAKEKSAVEYLIDEWDYGYCARNRWRCGNVLKTVNPAVFGNTVATTLAGLGTAILNFYVGAPSCGAVATAQAEVRGYYIETRFDEAMSFLVDDITAGRRKT